MTDVLVLNSGFVPIRIISAQDAVCSLYLNKAFTVVETTKVLRSPSITFRVPSVISLIGYSHFPKMKVGFSKLNVIYRDDMTCQFCGKKFNMNDLTVDHIIPRSRWSLEKRTSKRDWTNWLNCVCSCKWCNNAKGNHLMEELGWKLIRKPYEPEYLPQIVISFEQAEKRGWMPFSKVNMRIIRTVGEN
jgi:5-methylcytosine-specific restriction endonuclease McrA